MNSSLFSFGRYLRRQRGSRSDRRVRSRAAGVEPLEARVLLAKVFWNVDADGFWDVDSNWVDEFGQNGVPDGGDDVYLDRPAGAFTVTHRHNGLTAGGNAISDVVGSLHFDRSTFVMDGGELLGNGDFEIGGTFIHRKGSLCGTVQITGTMI